MDEFIRWADKNKAVTLLLAIALYMSIVVFHDEATILVIRIRRSLSAEVFNLIITSCGVLGLGLFSVYSYRHIRNSGSRLSKSFFLISIVAFIALTYTTLLFSKVEAIHYFQYGALAILLFPLIKRYGDTVFWVSILGVLDETYQYLILTPNFNYFDFNDIILNELGAALGITLIYVFADPVKHRIPARWYKNPSVLSGIMIIIGFGILLFTGLMDLYPEVNANQGSHSLFTLNRSLPSTNFWIQVQGGYYHVLHPFEGIIIIIGLIIPFYLLDNKTNPKGL